MSFTSKKPLIKQSSLFDSGSKLRPGLSSKRVSFESTVLTDSDEENSLGRHNRRPVKNKEDDDDLLNLFKNELSDSDEDDVTAGSKEKDKPSPKPRHKPETKSDEDGLLQTDDLEQTINSKRKPKPPPRKRTVDGHSEDLETESHETMKPIVHPRHNVMSKERPLSATQRKSELETEDKRQQKKNKSRMIFEDSDEDDIIITSSKKASDKITKNKELENKTSKSKEGKLDSHTGESVISFSSKQRKQKSLEEEDEAINREFKNGNQNRMFKNKSTLLKASSKSSEDEEEFENRKLINKDRKTLNDDYQDKKGKSEKSSFQSKNTGFEDMFNSKRIQKDKDLTTPKLLLDDSDDDDDIKKKRGKGDNASIQSKFSQFQNKDSLSKRQQEKALSNKKQSLDDSDDDDAQKKKIISRKLVKDENGLEDRNINRNGAPAPPPRRHVQDTSKTTDFKYKMSMNDSDVDTDEDKRDTVLAPKPRRRKDLNTDNPSRSALQSKLHYLDKSDEEEDDNQLLRSFQAKSKQKANAKDVPDGKSQSGKVAGWSSLDDSEDDEAVGKKISLHKTRPVSAKRQPDNKISKEDSPKPSPRPRHFSGSTKPDKKQQEEALLEKHSKAIRYDVNQNLTKDKKNDKGRESPHRDRVSTPQRPRNSQRRQNGWSRDDEDFTHTFEEHVPDTSEYVVGRTPGSDRVQRNAKDHRRPQSLVTPKRGPMKAERRIEEMTKSPQLRQTMEWHDHEDDDWRFRSQRSLGKQKASSLTNLHQTGQSDYTGYDSDDDVRRNSLDTQTIRQTVYENWLSRKNVTIKKELSKKALQKQKEEELAREKEEKRRSAESAFKTWSERKKESLEEQKARIKAQKKQEKEKELEKELKKRDATKYFESWKSKKDEIIKEVHKEKKKEKTEKKKKEEEDMMEKTVSSKKSFENWKAKKDDILKQQYKEKKKHENLEGTKKQDEEYEKTIKNADEFQKWVEQKGKPRKNPPPPKITQRAWVPGSRHTADCIPGKVQPVILPPSSNRARTMSGTFRTTKKYYDY